MMNKQGKAFGLVSCRLRVALLAASTLFGTLGLAAPRAMAQDSADAAAPMMTTDERHQYDLVIGENHTLSALNVKNYSEGAKGIVEVKLTTDKSQFVVVGRAPGSTTLLLIMKDGTQQMYEFNVFKRSPETVRRELEALLKDMGNLQVRRLGLRFFIEGGVASQQELERVNRVAALYPGQVESLVVVGAGASQRQLNVRLDFFFVQYDRNTGLQVGVDWPGRIGGVNVVQNSASFDLINGELVSATANIVNQPLPALDIAQNNGWAKVLRHATVITANGTKANYSSGGEQNFEIANGLTSTIQSIPFGTQVTVLPRYDSDSGDFQIDVNADVSELVAGSTRLPGRAQSKLTTSVRLKLGQSLVLSGIRSTTERRTSKGLPFLSSLPIIGALFGTQGFNVENVEGALFIVPSAVDAVPKPAASLVEDALKQFDKYSGDLDEVDPPYPAKPADWLSGSQMPSSSGAAGSSTSGGATFKVGGSAQ